MPPLGLCEARWRRLARVVHDRSCHCSTAKCRWGDVCRPRSDLRKAGPCETGMGKLKKIRYCKNYTINSTMKTERYVKVEYKIIFKMTIH